MEYKLSTASNYIDVIGTEITGLVAGTYNVRHKAKPGYNASEDTDITITNQSGYSIPESIHPIRGVAPTTAISNDGMIILPDMYSRPPLDPGQVIIQIYPYPNSDLEYSRLDSYFFMPVTSREIMGLSPGKYIVRNTYYPDWCSTVEVPRGPNASQNAPSGLSGTSASDANDGKITGTSTLMEYKLSTSINYIPATSTQITGLCAGTYNIRYAAKNGYNASASVNIEVPFNQTYEPPQNQPSPVTDFNYTSTATSVTITGYKGPGGAVTIPPTIDGKPVKYIGSNAFYNFTSITSITLPNSIVSIGDYAFYFCMSMTNINIPNGVISVGKSAFSECESLLNITIPSSVTSIGDYPFSACVALTAIDVDLNNLNYSSHEGVLFNKSKTKLIKCPESKEGAYTIPDGVTSIERYAFRSCMSLTTIIIPIGVTAIGVSAFDGCELLTNIQLPNSVTTIGNAAFGGCGSLTSIIIPPNVTSIGDFTFAACASLTSITIPNSVISIGDYAFHYSPSVRIYCNSGSFAEQFAISKYINYTLLDSHSQPAPTGLVGIPPSSAGGSDGKIIGTTSAMEYKLSTSGTYLMASDIETTGLATGTYNVRFKAKEGYNASTFVNVVIEDQLQNQPAPTGLSAVSPSSINATDGRILGTTTLMEYKKSTSETYIAVTGTQITGLGIGTYNVRFKAKVGYNAGAVKNVDITNTGSSSDFTYTNNGTSITITKYNGAGGAVTIPSTFAGKPVTNVGFAAFSSCKTLTSIIIPNSVTSISQNAFAYCESLAEVSIPDSVTSIGIGAFADCLSLVSITIPNSVTSISKDTFLWDDSLTIVNIPSSVTSIGFGAFTYCDNLHFFGQSGSYAQTYAAANSISFSTGTPLQLQSKPIGLSAVAATSSVANDGKITGATTAMEYKKSTSSSYTSVTGSIITGLSSGKYQVRYKAKGGYYAGAIAYVVIEVNQLQNQPAPTGLAGVTPTTFGGSDGKITGTTSAMEYKLSTSGTYITASNTETTGLPAGTYNVRFAAITGYNAGAVANVVIQQYQLQNQPAPTGLSGVIPTTYGGADGKITGTTSSMEYKLSISGTYLPASDIETTGLPAGTYNVRFAAITGYKAGAVATVVIPDGQIIPSADKEIGLIIEKVSQMIVLIQIVM